MKSKITGWFIAFAALGMMLSLLAGDVGSLKNWNDMYYPAFISGVMAHIASVIGAFVGGNLIPNMFDKKDV